MTQPLDDTLSALQENGIGLEPARTAELLDVWTRALEDADFEGADILLGLLERLQAALEDDEPDGALLSELLSDLSGAVEDVADATDDDVAAKLQTLSDLLADMSEEAAV